LSKEKEEEEEKWRHRQWQRTRRKFVENFFDAKKNIFSLTGADVCRPHAPRSSSETGAFLEQKKIFQNFMKNLLIGHFLYLLLQTIGSKTQTVMFKKLTSRCTDNVNTF
jgi:hypothetical protein